MLPEVSSQVAGGYHRGVPDRLSTYRKKRNPVRTSEPVPPEGPLPRGEDDTFVIQEHHARRLHWDLRLERGGVLVSWAVPKGLPTDPRRNHLAVPTEDHPLEYASFSGEIPRGEHGGGTVTIWDRGRYTTEKWTEREVMVVLHGRRASGRYVLFRTGEQGWLIHRMDPLVTDTPVSDSHVIPPMLAVAGPLPDTTEDSQWAYEMKWDGIRALVHVNDGQAQIMNRNGRDVTASYPELDGLGRTLKDRACVLDGEIVAFQTDGRVSFNALQQRMHVGGPAQARQLAARVPVVFLAFDLLRLDGRSIMDEPYRRRRALLEAMELAGPAWHVPPYFPGAGAAAMRASGEGGLEGVVAKRLNSAYAPGQRSPDWIKVKAVRTQEVVIGGWKPGQGRRSGRVGSLLLGVHSSDGLIYVGRVGTGFTRQTIEDLTRRLRPLERKTPPFAEEVPRQFAKEARWVSPRLVGEVVFTEWTRNQRLRAPLWRGLRTDKAPEDVVREPD
jgi:bifunctional non-homologous end joining protein LigD